MHRCSRVPGRPRLITALAAFLITCLLSVSPAPAQDEGSGGAAPGDTAGEPAEPGPSGGGADWIRLESAQAGRTPAEQTEVHVIYAQATSPDRGAQLRAVRRIRELVEKNDPVSRFPEVSEIISLLVLEPYRVSRRGGTGADPADASGSDTMVRVEAVSLLGRIGGNAAYGVVLELLRRERDPTVRAAALRTLPRIDERPGDELPGVLAEVIRRSHGDPATIRVALSSIRSLHMRYGFLDTPELFTAVIDVAQGPYPRSVRTEAFEVVELLRE